ncbi:MAG: hypothetical protein FGM61_11705, partial [Sediminibacterium sp.]|nr:hypothetical protein [Sediminibacterium sp.]
MALLLALQTQYFQNKLIGWVTGYLSKELKTEISIRHISLSLFNKANIEGILIRDHQHDTLLYAGQLNGRITDWFFLKKNLELTYLGLEDARINLHRKDSIWNYQFLVDYFSSADTTPKKKKPLELQLKKIDCKRLQVIQDDRWVGEKMVIKTAALLVNIDKTDLAHQTFIINSVYLDQPFFQLQNLVGLRPPLPPPPPAATKREGLYFNSGNLIVQVKNIKINNGSIWIDDDLNKPVKGFEEAHI